MSSARAVARIGLAIAIMIALLALIAAVQAGIDSERGDLGLTHNGISSSASTFAELFGGLRTATAAYLWIKLDRIHDDFYGDLTKEAELIPIFRIVAWLNPHIEDAYYVGSFMLYQQKRPKEAWDFATEGLRMNPGSAKLELNLGQYELIFKHDNRRALTHFERARRLCKDDEVMMLILASLKVVYNNVGMPAKARGVERELASLRNHVPVK